MRTNTQQFLIGLRMLKKLAPANPSLPVLRQVVFTGEEMRVTDLSAELSIPFRSDFKVVVDVHLLYKVVYSLRRHDIIEMVEVGNKLVVTASTLRFELLAEPVRDFPEFKVGPEYDMMFCAVLSNNLISASAFTGSDSLRPVMSTVCIGKDVAATDAHMLYRVGGHDCKVEDYTMMVPKSALKLLPRNLSLDIWKSRDCEFIAMTVLKGGIVLRWRIPEGRFPNYMAVWPERVEMKYVMDAALLRECVEAAGPMSNRVTNRAEFRFAGGVLTISCEDPETGNGFRCDVPYRAVAGEHLFTIGFSLRFMERVLTHVGGSGEVEFGMNEANKAVIINDMALIMPVTLND
jgi:DNA polymerase III subunit beta